MIPLAEDIDLDKIRYLAIDDDFMTSWEMVFRGKPFDVEYSKLAGVLKRMPSLEKLTMVYGDSGWSSKRTRMEFAGEITFEPYWKRWDKRKIRHNVKFLENVENSLVGRMKNEKFGVDMQVIVRGGVRTGI